MTAGQAPGPYSPDGRFWWDGTAWRPVQPSPGPQPGPAGPPPGSVGPWPGPGGPPYHLAMPGPQPPPRAKRGLLLPLVGTVIVALLLGGGIGGVVGLLTTEVPGSPKPPAFAADFPGEEHQYLPDLTLAMVVDDWMKKSNSWRCEKEPADPNLWSRAKQVMECEPPDDDDRDMYVHIEYDTDDRIRVLDATCRLGTYHDVCRSLFGTMADIALSPQGELREKAESWARKNAGSEKATIMGGVRLQANLEPNGLRITPEY